MSTDDAPAPQTSPPVQLTDPAPPTPTPPEPERPWVWAKDWIMFIGRHPILTILALVIVGVCFYKSEELSDRLTPDWLQQRRLAITVAMPTVHTRERLLNDRFEQVAWLDRALALTTLQTTEPTAPPRPTTKEPAATAAASEKLSLAGSMQTETSVRSSSGALRQSFEVMNGVRDLMRAERARAMLDDRHDIDSNTLDLFSFDATTMPNGSASGYAAVEVLLTRDPADIGDITHMTELIDSFNARKALDLFDIYVGWLESNIKLQQTSLKSLAAAIDKEDKQTFPGIFPTLSSPARDEALRRLACERLTESSMGSIVEKCSKEAKKFIDRLLEVADGIPRSVRLYKWLFTTRLALQSSLLRAEQALDSAVINRDKYNVRKSLIAMLSGRLENKNIFKTLAKIIDECTNKRYLPNKRPAQKSTASAPDRYLVSSLLDDLQIYAAQFDEIMPGEVPALNFDCAADVDNATKWRVLTLLLQTLEDDPTRQPLLTDLIIEWDDNGNWLFKLSPNRQLSSQDFDKVSVNCIAAQILVDGLTTPSAKQARNHGASLAEFFNIKVGRTANDCAIRIEPRVQSLRELSNLPLENTFPCGQPRSTDGKDLPLLAQLDCLLEGPGYGNTREQVTTKAYGYALSPRLRQTVEVEGQRRREITVDLSDGAGNLGSVHRVEYRGVEPEVVGFTRRPENEDRIKGARFGWIMASRPGKDLSATVPLEQAQLSAVVALPSWWRTAFVQICTRYLPRTRVADVVTAEFWNKAKDSGGCRVDIIRLPGTSADVSRRLGMDVMTTPYMESSVRPITVRAGLTTEPTQLVINGERLWRNTVVTIGGQKADQIEVLPDMRGISATFTCIRRPLVGRQPTAFGSDTSPEPNAWFPSLAASDRQASATPGPPAIVPYTVPVVVWTSEGHTEEQDITVEWPTNADDCPGNNFELTDRLNRLRTERKDSPPPH